MTVVSWEMERKRTMIDFEIPEFLSVQLQALEQVALQVMRPAARYYDEHEHERPWEYIKLMWEGGNNAGFRGRSEWPGGYRRAGMRNVVLAHTVEMLSYGDCGLYLSTPGGRPGRRRYRVGGHTGAAVALSGPLPGR